MAPARPANEESRLAALASYAILDTPFEQEYDELCRLAATLCGTPIALISLVDRDRQWSKSAFGLGTRETVRDQAFCSHAIWQEHVFEIPDATKDHRFADNPLVTGEPDIRFYAGKPLLTPEGLALGTLCVIDRVPRQLTSGQREALTILARQVMTHLELRRSVASLERSSREKEEFLGLVAHDLRSPLAGILSLSDYLVDELPRLSTAEVSELATGLSRSIHQAYDLAENLLTWALLAQGTMTFRPESLVLSDLMSSVLDPLVLPLRLKSLKVHIDVAGGLVVRGDRAMIETAVRNLVTNAMKFSTPGHPIALTATLATVNGGSAVRISVKDEGSGIPPEVLEQLQDGIRAHGRLGTAGERGSGLGLTLVRQFAARHGGQLEIESVWGRGTTATLVLPATQPVAQQS